MASQPHGTNPNPIGPNDVDSRIVADHYEVGRRSTQIVLYEREVLSTGLVVANGLGTVDALNQLIQAYPSECLPHLSFC